MSHTKTPRIARALAPFLVATALVSIPAFAQDAAPQTAQPVVTPPSAPTIAIPPVVRTVPDGATATTAAPAEEAAPRAAPRTTRTTATRSTATRTAARAAPARPAATAAPAPVAAPVKTTATTTTTKTATPPAPTAPVAQAPEAQPAAPATTQTDTSTTTSGVPTWAWIAGGIALLAIVLGAIAALRRRRVDEYDYAEPEPVIEPVAAAPVVEPVAASPRKEPEYLRRETTPVVGEVEPAVAAAEDVAVSSAPAEEVAELTATAPVAERPWLEFAMRPVRAGTNIDEALVEIELTVGNAGSVPAKDVRISTFLLSGDAAESEMERLLVDAPADATTDPVTIQPGEGKRIDATLALLKADMGENLPEAFRPIVVADARYTLEDGTEGRTSASFTVGVAPEEGGALEPIELSRASMHENVGAELHGEPQHA